MAEAIVAVGLLSTIAQLIDYGTRVLERVREFQNNVKNLPQCFQSLGEQLPLLINTVERLRAQLRQDETSHLEKVLDGLCVELAKVDALLQRVLPTATASTWEKCIRGFKSIGIEDNVKAVVAMIQTYVSNLTFYQTTHNTNLIQELMDEVRLQKINLSVAQLSEQKATPFLVDYGRDAHFTGRDDVMNAIVQQFKVQNRVALAGIGGVGKSRLAIEFAYQYREQNPSTPVFWVHGGSRARFQEAFQEIASSLSLPGSDDGTINFLKIVGRWLNDESKGPWLMILDNADDIKLWLDTSKAESTPKTAPPLFKHLPRGNHGKILITTRDYHLGNGLLEGIHKPIRVERLAAADARVLLQSKLSNAAGMRVEDIDELATALEYLPLAITQAAAYLEQIDISAVQYLELLRTGQSDIPELLKESIHDPARDFEASHSVFLTWMVSFHQISQQSKRAADTLSLMAMLDRQSISKELLLQPTDTSIQFQAAIAKLRAFSLIEEHQDQTKYGLHRLVQLSTQMWLERNGTLSNWEEAAIFTIAKAYPAAPEYEYWTLYEHLNSHARVALRYNIKTSACLIQRAKMLHSLSLYVGLYFSFTKEDARETVDWVQEAVSIRTRELGYDNEDTLQSMGLLGAVYDRIEWTDQAQELQKDVFTRAVRVLGPEHRFTLKTMSRLAITYKRKRKLQDCEQLQTETLGLMKQTLGRQDLDTLREMSNLVHTRIKLKKYAAAEKVALELLDQRSRVRGRYHPDTLTAMTLLAWVYTDQHRLNDANCILEQVKDSWTQLMGPDYPKVEAAERDLSKIYSLKAKTVAYSEDVLP